MQAHPTDQQPCWIIGVSGSVRAGFPSPAEDFAHEPINLTSLLIPHPLATFFMRVSGESMREAGIEDGDWVLVDRAVRPQTGHIVVGIIHNEFTIKYLRKSRGGVPFLEPANATYPPFHPREGSLEIFGVVRTAFRAMPGFSIKQ